MELTEDLESQKGVLFKREQKKSWASLVAQCVKNPPATQQTAYLLLGQEDPLQKG